MSIDISLQNIANQSLSVTLGESRYVIELKEANGVMAMSVTRDGEVVMLNGRIVSGSPCLPYRYMEDGNFVLTTENEDVPYYDQFGITQFLLYLDAAEVAALRG